MKILFLIPSCERPQMVERLIQQIYSQSPLPVKIIVTDDGSESDYSKVKTLLERNGDCYYRFIKNHGKKYYWQVVDKLFQLAKEEEFDYVFKLDDDIVLHPQAIKEAIDKFGKISSYHSKTVFNLWVDHRADKRVWTGIEPEVINIRGTKIRKVGWVDGGNWMAGAAVLKALNWHCPEPPQKWFRSSGDSSGVGKYLSVKLSRLACRIYMPMESLVYHGGHQSIMHSHKDPKNRPIVMKNKPWE